MSTATTGFNPLTYDRGQTQILLKLLAEYTGKLRNECEKYERGIENTRSDLIKGAIAVFLFAVLVTFQIWLDLHHTTTVSSTRSVNITLPVLSFFEFVAIAFMVASVVKLLNAVNKFRRIMGLQVSIAVAQLERLVRRISPIAEYSGVNLGEKLEFDLRLADADTALEYAAQYTGKRAKSEKQLGFEKNYEASLQK